MTMITGELIGIIDGACETKERQCIRCGKTFMSDGLRRCPDCICKTDRMADVKLQPGEHSRGKQSDD